MRACGGRRRRNVVAGGWPDGAEEDVCELEAGHAGKHRAPACPWLEPSGHIHWTQTEKETNR